MLREQHRFFRSVWMCCDVVVLVAAVVLAYWTRYHFMAHNDPSPHFRTHAIPILAYVPIMILAMIWSKLYVARRDQRFVFECGAIIRAVVIGMGVTVVIVTMLRNVLFGPMDYSRVQFILGAGYSIVLLTIWRLLFRVGLRRMRSRGWNLRHVAVIGTGRLGQVVYHTLRRNSWTGINPAYFISHEARAPRESCLGLPVCGGLADLETVLDGSDVTGVFIALPGNMATELGDLLLRLERYPIDVRVVPDMHPKYMPINMSVNTLDGMPVLSVRQSPLASGWGRIMKRALDVVGAIIAIIIFAIPMAAVAVGVRLSGPGPIIFRQERMGISGQRFMMYKFRTMTHVSAERLALRSAENRAVREAERHGHTPAPATIDAEITRVGRFIRRTSLDEFPQLFNVLLGEMSLVGPRPEQSELIEHFREDWRGYMLRQNVKAGMTGWAQVNGLRGRTSVKKRIQYDLFYIRNWSLMFDLRILWMTIFRFSTPSPL